MHTSRLTRRPLAGTMAAAFVLLTLAACGGGGGSSPTTTTADQGTKGALATSAAGSLSASSSVAASQPYTWSFYPGGTSVAVDASENVYTVDWTSGAGGDIFLTKRDRQGVVAWTKGYDNIDPTRDEVANWVETDPAGNVLVAGTIRSGTNNPVNAARVLMKFNSDGFMLWRRIYDSDFDGSYSVKLLVDRAGNAYVLGLGMSPTMGQRTTVRKFDPEGKKLWDWFDPDGIGAPLNFKWTPEGALVIAARSTYGSINGYAKISAHGQTIWTLPGITSLTAGDVAGDSAGNSYLINGPYMTGMTGSVLRKINNAGAPVWDRTHTIAGTRVEVGTDDAPVVGGFPRSGSFGVAFAKWTKDGLAAWENMDADGTTEALLGHAQMKLDAANNAYLVASNMTYMGAVKVLADTGGTAWTVMGGSGYARGMALGSSDRLFVAGGMTAAIDGAGARPPLPPLPGDPPPPPPPEDPPPPPPPPAATADLGVALSGPSSVRVNTGFTLTATVTNVGPNDATAARLTASLPSFLTLQSIVPTVGTCIASATPQCDFGPIATGGKVTVWIALNSTKKTGTSSVVASISSTVIDPVPGNNSASKSISVTRR